MIYIVQSDSSVQLLHCSLIKSRLNFIKKRLDSNTRLSCSWLILTFYLFLLELCLLGYTGVNLDMII